jgi:hypothetical protein
VIYPSITVVDIVAHTPGMVVLLHIVAVAAGSPADCTCISADLDGCSLVSALCCTLPASPPSSAARPQKPFALALVTAYLLTAHRSSAVN